MFYQYRDAHAVYETAFGLLKIGYRETCVTEIYCITNKTELSQTTKTPFTDTVFKEIQEYAQGLRSHFSVPYILQGSPFQKKVWESICSIPYGETRSYGDIARQTGSPGICRAVGTACKNNHILFIVPCHRVIRTDGSPGQYSGGAQLKTTLLMLEKRYSTSLSIFQ